MDSRASACLSRIILKTVLTSGERVGLDLWPGDNDRKRSAEAAEQLHLDLERL